MREINVELITKEVENLFIKANKILPCSLKRRINEQSKSENDELAKSVLNDLIENLNASKELDVPICQDTGMAVVFINIGQDVHFVGGDLYEAINEGVKNAYVNGLLRLSIVSDPLERINTNTNTPAIIHTQIVPGDKVEIVAAPKGFGSENMSAIKMFTPSATKEDIMNFVINTVKNAGSNPCPPIVVGVGIGGDFEYSAILAKKALCRDVDTPNDTPFYKDMEQTLLTKINELNIGPQGFGGKTTALAVNIETYAAHIAGLPVAVNIGCHVTRHAKTVI